MQNYIKTISEKNPEINAFIEVYSKEALSTASQIDKKISNGTAGKLAGMVVGIKDNICFKNHKISASSKMLKDFKPLYSSTVVDLSTISVSFISNGAITSAILCLKDLIQQSNVN